MRLVKNISSGKFFIVLEDDGGPRFQAITPEGKIKRLERHLFGKVAADHKDSPQVRNITAAQVNMLAMYGEDDDH